MTKTTMSLADLDAKHDDGDFLRAVAQSVLQLIIEADVDASAISLPDCDASRPPDNRLDRTRFR